MSEQMPTWVTWALVAAMVVWAFGMGFAFEERLVRMWVRRGSGGWRTAARVVLLHCVILVICLASMSAVIGLRDSTTYRTWSLGAVFAVTIALLGPVVLVVMPSRSGLAPDTRTLTRAGASRTQARVIQWVGIPFAALEMSLLVTMAFPAFLP